MNKFILRLFNRTIGLVFAILLLFVTFGIVVGVAGLFRRLGDLLQQENAARQYVGIISEVLTLFVLIELSRSLASHFSERRIRLTFIADAGIVFVLREIMIKLFERAITPEDIYALSALLLALGGLRTAAAWVYQREKRMQARMQAKKQSKKQLRPSV